MNNRRCRIIGLGGTFDHFHKGHERFLLYAGSLGELLKIGVTTAEFVQKKPLAEQIEGYEVRTASVAEFCERQGLLCEIFPLSDVYGPTLAEGSVEAFCVTGETLPGALLINKARGDRGLAPLPVHVCEFLLDELGSPLHSIDIRAGKVNREGKVYERLLAQSLKLTEKQRQFFAQPQGILLSLAKDGKSLARLRMDTNAYAVGDATLEYFLREKLPYQMGVYDKRIARKEVRSPAIDALKPDITAVNEAGTLSLSLASALKQALKTGAKHVFVEGEEDLAAVALVLLLPLGSTIYYGQPGKGIVELLVTEIAKESFSRALNS